MFPRYNTQARKCFTAVTKKNIFFIHDQLFSSIAVHLVSRGDKDETKSQFLHPSGTNVLASAKNVNTVFRHYHSTKRQDLVLYGSIIVVAGLSYAGYCKYYGKPIKPESATVSQRKYKEMEEDRRKRNMSNRTNNFPKKDNGSSSEG